MLTKVRSMTTGGGQGSRLAAIAAALVVSAIPSYAQEPEAPPFILEEPNKKESTTPDPAAGLQTARTLCAACHLIGEPPTNAATPADVPSFASVANRPDQSAERLSNWLIQPHTPMPNLHLTRKEIRDLSAYILTLRTAK
jgi:mono/diheme cytochrome c family protein